MEHHQQQPRFEVFKGCPEPLGVTPMDDGGFNFAIFSRHSCSAVICLMTLADLETNKVSERIPLDPASNRTGDIWHVLIRGDLKGYLYGYELDSSCPQQGYHYDPSRILVDPYAKAVVRLGDFGVMGADGNPWPQMAGMITSSEEEFDWEGDHPLHLPREDLVIYEMHVRGFTRHPSSHTSHPGTYSGLIEKLDYLKDLGINCIELMPCHEFNELESHRLNFWGYSTINFFSPMIRYSSAGVSDCGGKAINEFKLLVRESHKRGIEVIMDVVFNHTAEGNEKGPALSFRGIDNSVYYMLTPMGEFYNYSGCGNTFNCNHPIVRQFILDCLRYWVTEMHVDGFRFDLATTLTRGFSLRDPDNAFGVFVQKEEYQTGELLTNPPLIHLISTDPLLNKVKLIAEPWDTGKSQLGEFPNSATWSEWNSDYRDVVRQFIKGTDGFAGRFAQCICGSPNLYEAGGKKPWASINFVTCHDGFTLADLVSYNAKYNSANGEANQDGIDENHSWNCAREDGWSTSDDVNLLRMRQMRNFIFCLMVSQGTPMIQMGDEYGHSKLGNNNSYCHDNDINYFRWDQIENGLCRFASLMIKFRREREIFRKRDFMRPGEVEWHGHRPYAPDWSTTSRFVAFTLKDNVKGDVYVAFNAGYEHVRVRLPPHEGHKWVPLVDTSKGTPDDFLTGSRDCIDSGVFEMVKYSAVLMLSIPIPV